MTVNGIMALRKHQSEREPKLSPTDLVFNVTEMQMLFCCEYLLTGNFKVIPLRAA